MAILYHVLLRIPIFLRIITYFIARRTYALDITSANKQEVVPIDICPDNCPEAVPSVKQMYTASHLDNSHTIELTMFDISLKVSNSADPLFLQ